MLSINTVSISLLSVFLLPLIIGMVNPLSIKGYCRSILSVIRILQIIISFILSLYLIKEIFSQGRRGIIETLYKIIPSILMKVYHNNHLFIYLTLLPLFFVLFMAISEALTRPVIKIPVKKLAYCSFKIACAKGRAAASLIRALWQLPKSFFMILLLFLIFHMQSIYFMPNIISKEAETSVVYTTIRNNIMEPVFQMRVAKNVPVLLQDSFGYMLDNVYLQGLKDGIASLPGLNIKTLRYFNGITLEKAVRSDEEIDGFSVILVSGEQTTRKKAYKIYRWISNNIEYDYEKAEKIVAESFDIPSGALAAYKSRSGICFDYSSLFISMCRASGIKSRLVTGLAFSGIAWGDHSWNQFYCNEEERWINVDCTFARAGLECFDSRDFHLDHLCGEIQGEW